MSTAWACSWRKEAALPLAAAPVAWLDLRGDPRSLGERLSMFWPG